jgi:two-component system chemotaxis sensor kinase CheA
MIEDIELREIFKASSEERLQIIDEGLLHLEKHPEDLETITSLMREAHSLKGDSNMLGVDDLGKVAHQIEHIFGAIKRGERKLTPTLFDRLARAMLAMRQIVHEAVTGEPAQVKVFYVLADLMAAEMAEEEAPASHEADVTATAAPTEDRSASVGANADAADLAEFLFPSPSVDVPSAAASQELESPLDLFPDVESVAPPSASSPIPDDDIPPGAIFDSSLDVPSEAISSAAEDTTADLTAVNPALDQATVADDDEDLFGLGPSTDAAPSLPATNGTSAPAEPRLPGERSPLYIADDEMRMLFKTSCEERLQALDEGILHLEKNPQDLAIVENIMREAHSLKGDSNMLGVADLGKVAHQVENILGALKRGETPLTPDICDRLAHGMKAMKQLVHEASTGEATGVNVFYVLAELMGASSDNPPGASPAATPSPAAPPPPEDPSIAIDQASKYKIETIRVPTTSLDSLMTQSGELTVTKIRVAHRLAEIDAITNLWEEWSRDLFMNRFLFHEAQQGKQVWRQLENFHSRTEQHLDLLGRLVGQLSSALYEDTTRLEMITDGLEEGIRTLRLLPLSTIFNLFPRLVRDLARQEGKQVELVIEGGETRADKRILEEMKDPLLHMIRNAIDHGIESPAERKRKGKPEVATITLRGYQTPTSIVLEICDDGRGLDVEAIKQTAVRRGLHRPEELELLTPGQIQALILSPGFSTRTMVTEISGRGVGLDVLRTNVERLKGNVEVHSTPGQGCTIRIQLGTTLATAHVLLVTAQSHTYALPVEFVQTACLVHASDIFTLEGHSTIVYDNQPVSVAWLADLLNLPGGSNGRVKSANQRLSCIILQTGHDKLGIFVDALIDEQDVVLKPQSQLLKRVRYISGATILGTGEVCMVLNPPDLIGTVRHRITQATLAGLEGRPAEMAEQRPKSILLVEDSIATRTQEKRILESAGYEVVTAVDGADGFNKLQSRAFDAVISDIQMPNLDGLQLTQRIRQHREYNELPVVLVTTLASDDDRRRGAEAGANAYITKGSFNQEVLLETLERLI